MESFIRKELKRCVKQDGSRNDSILSRESMNEDDTSRLRKCRDRHMEHVYHPDKPLYYGMEGRRKLRRSKQVRRKSKSHRRK